MPPLTLEQVLARSMRLPRQRAGRHVSKLYQRSSERPSGRGNGLQQSMTSTFSSPNRASSFTTSTTGLMNARGTAHRDPVRQTQQEKLHFLQLMEKEEADQRAHHLFIHRSTHLVQNGIDLSTHLRAAQQTGDWEAALQTFVDATQLPFFLHPSQSFGKLPEASMFTAEAAATSPGGTRSSTSNHSANTAPPSSSPPQPHFTPTGVNPTDEQLNLLISTCAKSEQWCLAERIAAYFARTHPGAILHFIELLSQTTVGSVSIREMQEMPRNGWQTAYLYLRHHLPISPSLVPVEAYNICLRGCEDAKDWRRAIEIIQAMGPNPLQGWNPTLDDANSLAKTSLSTDAVAVTAADGNGTAAASPSPLPHPPSPNVVSYATLIATLEQAGKDAIAAKVLSRLPPIEKEEITASYAALILVWSDQVLHRHRRRF